MAGRRGTQIHLSDEEENHGRPVVQDVRPIVQAEKILTMKEIIFNSKLEVVNYVNEFYKNLDKYMFFHGDKVIKDDFARSALDLREKIIDNLNQHYILQPEGDNRIQGRQSHNLYNVLGNAGNYQEGLRNTRTKRGRFVGGKETRRVKKNKRHAKK